VRLFNTIPLITVYANIEIKQFLTVSQERAIKRAINKGFFRYHIDGFGPSITLECSIRRILLALALGSMQLHMGESSRSLQVGHGLW